MKTQELSTLKRCQTLTCSLQASPASHFLSLVKDGALTTREVLSSLKLPGWLEQKDLHIFSLRTSQDSYRRTKAGRLRPSSIRYHSWGTMSNGRCLTARILAFLNPGSGCTLSDILTPDVPERYFLSETQAQRLLSSS